MHFYINLKWPFTYTFSNFNNILYKTIKLTTNFIMIPFKNLRFIFVLILSTFVLSSCNGKLPGGDARKNSDDPKLRVKKNIEEGRGFRLNDSLGKTFGRGSGVFDFASSNELWRASLDTVDFMPLASVNYSGGIIITDWYSTDQASNESIKISIRFLTNEIRSDALKIKVFNKKCISPSNCVTFEKQGNINTELKKKILKTAALYKAQKNSKNSKEYKGAQKY